MAEIDNLKSDLEEIQTARDNIKTALQNEGETVTNDIRTYADAIPNVNKVKTVNSVEADTNKNVQLDASKINIDDTAETKQSIKTFIETLRSDVDNISVPEYSVIETTVTEGYSKTYSLTKDGTEVGVKINIPKDLVVNKGSVKVVATAGTPYEGAVVGDKYLDIELNDPTKDHIYIPVKELVDVYTAGDGIEISTDNIIKSKNSNLVNGEASGSIRSKDSASETSTYKLGGAATALGFNTEASGPNSHAEGSHTKSSGASSHAEGGWSSATGNYSHAEGTGTIASSNNSHAEGRYNIEDTENKYAHIIGNGSVDGTTRSNAHTVAWDGTGWFAGSIKVGGTSQDDENAKQLATEEYVNEELNARSVVVQITEDKPAGYSHSLNFESGYLMVFLNGEKLIGKDYYNSNKSSYSYEVSDPEYGIDDGTHYGHVVTFTDDFTLTKGDILEFVLFNDYGIN